MENGALRKVTALSPDARQAMESLLGRSLREDEAVSINVFHPAPTGAARHQASQRLLERIDRTAEKALGVSESEIDAAIDEAVDHIRHSPG